MSNAIISALSRDQILHLASLETLTARARSSHPGRLAWVGVVSLEAPKTLYLNTALPHELGRLRITYFEVDAAHIKSQYDTHPDDLVNASERDVDNCAGLPDVLALYGVEVTELTFKGNTDYPL